MVKQPKYQLKINYLTKDKLNRYVRNLIEDISKDRANIIEVLTGAKTRLSDVPEGAENTFNYTATLKEVSNLLGQLQDVNNTSIKTLNIILDVITKENKDKAKDSELSKTKNQKKKAQSVFEQLQNLTGSTDDEEED